MSLQPPEATRIFHDAGEKADTTQFKAIGIISLQLLSFDTFVPYFHLF
jgi:hypothetical protein